MPIVGSFLLRLDRVRPGALVLSGVLIACGASTDTQSPVPCAADPCGMPASDDPSVDAGPPDANPSKDAGAVVDADAGDADADASAAPSATDGIKNGTETDVDCGGPDAMTPRCAAHQTCLAGGDCAIGICGTMGPANGRCLSAPSCNGAAGTFACGIAGDEDCCTTLPVPSATFNRFADPNYPASVSSFNLDKYEITVARLRAYFAAVSGSPKSFAPAPGAGAHPKIAASGWRSSFDVRLPASWTEINDRLGVAGCTVGGDNSDGGTATWTADPGPYESYPITCADWYTLFAFCVWDGGRLPTQAEWGLAGQGGNQDRAFAWGGKYGDPSTGIVTPWGYEPPWGVGTNNDLAAIGWMDANDQLFKFTTGTAFRSTDPVTGQVNDGPAHLSPAGAKIGSGRWGHADMTGNVLELQLDATPAATGDCIDCANVAWADPPQDQVGFYPPQWVVGNNDPPLETDWVDGYRSLQGASFDPDHVPWVWYQYDYRLARTYGAAGARCAR